MKHSGYLNNRSSPMEMQRAGMSYDPVQISGMSVAAPPNTLPTGSSFAQSSQQWMMPPPGFSYMSKRWHHFRLSALNSYMLFSLYRLLCYHIISEAIILNAHFSIKATFKIWQTSALNEYQAEFVSRNLKCLSAAIVTMVLAFVKLSRVF